MRDLFEDPSPASASGYERAFQSWSAEMRGRGRITAGASLAVYEDMWMAFANYAAAHGFDTLDSVDTALLLGFIRARDGRSAHTASPRYVWRVLTLIDWVLRHAARELGATPNEAPMDLLATNPDWQYANARKGEPIDYLVPKKAKRLLEHLSQARPRVGRPPLAATWQEIRNSTSVSLQLGAGLTPAEIRGLTVESVRAGGTRSVDVPWRLIVQDASGSSHREAPIARWASQLLNHWLDVRLQINMPGPWLFPSTRKGSQWTKPAQYEAVKQVLTNAGWAEAQVKGGSFRLRHTYALRQLRRGHDERLVAQWLGIEPEAMERYRKLLLAPV